MTFFDKSLYPAGDVFQLKMMMTSLKFSVLTAVSNNVETRLERSSDSDQRLNLINLGFT